MSLDVGRICIKKTGRERGKKCLIVDLVDENFVIISGPQSITGVRRRRSNVNHVQVTDEIVNFKKGASDEDIVKAVEKAKKIEFLKNA